VEPRLVAARTANDRSRPSLDLTHPLTRAAVPDGPPGLRIEPPAVT